MAADTREKILEAAIELFRERGFDEATMREIASRELVKVNADDDLSSALQLMSTEQVRRIPVVDDDGRLVGILAQADIAGAAKEKAVGEMVEEISKSPTGPRSRRDCWAQFFRRSVAPAAVSSSRGS